MNVQEFFYLENKMSLIVEHLTKKYGEKTVVDDLSFQMKEHGVYALLGTNGAGKTTSIRMMLGMLAKDGGRVEWNGRKISEGDRYTVTLSKKGETPAKREATKNLFPDGDERTALAEALLGRLDRFNA